MWEPVAKLTESDGVYRFAYTLGAMNERFVPFPRMDLLNKEYQSKTLFPFFQNRLIPERRPEYYSMLSWLDMAPGSNDPLEILSASGGSKKTDNFRVVKVPRVTTSGNYQVKFFVSGVAYVSDEAKHHLLSLRPGGELGYAIEGCNKADSDAIVIVSRQGGLKLGYYPHYLNKDLILVNQMLGVADCKLSTRFKVIKVNFSAPEQYRLLCECITPWPDGFVPFQSEKYQLVVAD